MDNSGLNGYILYLQLLQKKIDGFFEEQKEYIACEKGCIDWQYPKGTKGVTFKQG